MALNIRRVVTGRDANGKAVVRIDDVGVHVASGRPHMSRQVIWTTNALPVHFTEDGEDTGAREIGTTITNGSMFRVVEYEPGVAPRNHRTDSIDYGVVMSGEKVVGRCPLTFSPCLCTRAPAEPMEHTGRLERAVRASADPYSIRPSKEETAREARWWESLASWG